MLMIIILYYVVGVVGQRYLPKTVMAMSCHYQVVAEGR